MLDMGIHAKFSYLLPKSIKFGRFFCLLLRCVVSLAIRVLRCLLRHVIRLAVGVVRSLLHLLVFTDISEQYPGVNCGRRCLASSTSPAPDNMPPSLRCNLCRSEIAASSDVFFYVKNEKNVHMCIKPEREVVIRSVGAVQFQSHDGIEDGGGGVAAQGSNRTGRRRKATEESVYTCSSLPISLNNIQESIVGAVVLPLRPPPRRTTCHRLSAVTCAARRSRPPQMCSSTSRTKRTYTCASSRRGRWSFEVWAPSSSKVTTA